MTGLVTACTVCNTSGQAQLTLDPSENDLSFGGSGSGTMVLAVVKSPDASQCSEGEAMSQWCQSGQFDRAQLIQAFNLCRAGCSQMYEFMTATLRKVALEAAATSSSTTTAAAATGSDPGASLNSSTAGDGST